MEKENKNQMWMWISITIATIVVVIIAVYFVLSKIEPNNENTISTDIIDIDSLETNKFDTLNFELDLQKNYVGTKSESEIDLKPIFLTIKNLNKQTNTFDYVFNIGVESKLIGIGNIDFEKSTIYTGDFGELKFHIDSRGRILLDNNHTKQTPKFEVTEETK